MEPTVERLRRQPFGERWSGHGIPDEGKAPAAAARDRSVHLSSGLGKHGADEATAAGVHGMAAGSYPFLGNIEPRTFTKLLSAG